MGERGESRESKRTSAQDTEDAGTSEVLTVPSPEEVAKGKHVHRKYNRKPGIYPEGVLNQIWESGKDSPFRTGAKNCQRLLQAYPMWLLRGALRRKSF